MARRFNYQQDRHNLERRIRKTDIAWKQSSFYAPHNIEINQVVCSSNKWTSFYMGSIAIKCVEKVNNN